MDDDAATLVFVDNPLAPDIFATNATGFFNFQGTIMVTLESTHVNHETSPGPVNRVVVGRLVMPANSAYNLAVGLFDFLKKQGFDFAQLEASGAKAN